MSPPDRVRCEWAGTDPLMVAYHDDEWGTPTHDDHALFELLTLEGAQAGLSWTTILRKRDGYRAAFAGFDPAKVARFTDADVERLLGDASIVRHRGKIESTISNARALLDAAGASSAAFDDYVWSFVDGSPIVSQHATLAGAPDVDRRGEGAGEGPQATRVPLRRARRRSTRSCRPRASPTTTSSPASAAPARPNGSRSYRPGWNCAVVAGAGVRSPASIASMRSSAMSWTLTSSSRPFSFTPSSIIT